MKRYIYATGGEDGSGEDDFFSNYLSLIENNLAGQDAPSQQTEEPAGKDEEDPFITNLRAYDEEQTADEKVESRIQEYISRLDAHMGQMMSSAQDRDVFADDDPDELGGRYNTQSSGGFEGIFRNEGARTGQPTNLNSSAVGRGQMIKGTREAMYRKLGISDIAAAEQQFRTDPNFEMKVLNAYKEDLDARIPRHVQGKQRQYMIAKGWYTGDPFYPDDKVPGREAGNKLTAGQYASRAVNS